jgi:uncharacterized phage protein gp47/JayE
MPTQSEYAARMVALLAVTDPDLDTGVGTTIRKQIDVIAEVMAEANADQYTLSYTYDIDTKGGEALDDFVRIFGVSRHPARRSSGEVVVGRSVSTQQVSIPAGTQLATADEPPILVITTVSANLLVGDTEVAVPAQAVTPGASGNIAAHSLVRNITSLNGITGFDNPLAFTGGADAESDEHLRARFKRTAFRNMAGTEGMYLAAALDDANAEQANVIGVSKRHREQIEIIGGFGVGTLVGGMAVYEGSDVVGADIDGGNILRAGLHYNFNPSVVPPSVTAIDSDAMPDGVYEVEYDYLPTASRNLPEIGITNRVDIYVWGTRSTEATETSVWRTNLVFTNDEEDTFFRERFRRQDEEHPSIGNTFTPLSFAPVIALPTAGEIVIAGETYEEGTDYWLVNDITTLGMTPQSYSGIEWDAAITPTPPDDEPFSLTYFYNDVPRAVAQQIAIWRLVGTDVLVHQAHPIRLNFNLAVILTTGTSQVQVESAISTVLASLLERVGFDGILQVSDVLAAVHSVSGVDAVRFITSTEDAVEYAMQRVNEEGDVMETYADGSGRAKDVVTDADSIPVFNDVRLVLKAPNTLGSA